jgi:sugar phosphate isomerase/epimerase
MTEKWPVGVFASIDAGLGVRLEVAQELGVRSVHLHTPHAGSRTPQRAAEFNKRLDELGIKISVVFAGFEGESYADIPTVEKTVGLMPQETRAERTAELKAIGDFAKTLGVDKVGVHLGFVPHDSKDPEYAAMIELTRDVCGHLKRNGQTLHLETGQEPVDVLIRFLDDTKLDNLFVNFDPANMILYGAGEPLPALEALGNRVRSVHCKDATWSDKPGETWGREVPLGEGDVDFAAFLNVLKRIGYDGPLTIEREIPQEPERQKSEIGRAIELLERLKKEIGK